MSYAVPQDMIDAFGQVEVTRLSSIDGDLSAINLPRVQTALDTASGIIDSHLSRRYACPLATIPAEVLRACLNLARYDLSFGGDTEPSEQTRLARKETIEWLGRLNTGSVTLEGVELASGILFARTQDRPSRLPPMGLYQGLGYGFGLGCW